MYAADQQIFMKYLDRRLFALSCQKKRSYAERHAHLCHPPRMPPQLLGMPAKQHGLLLYNVDDDEHEV